MAQQLLLAALLLLTQGLPAAQSEKCSVPGDDQVTGLLTRMLKSFKPADRPNPSILLALRLASVHNLEVERAMAQRIKDDAVHRIQNHLDFTSGTVALYVMALQASCENPRNVSGLDLVQLLKDKYEQEMKSVEEQRRLLTNYYQTGLAIMALCLQNVPISLDNVLRVSCPQVHYGFGVHHSVDTASVLALALACVADRKELHTMPRPAMVRNTLSCLVQTILSGKKADGVIGNIYSTGLAMQALSVSQAQDCYEPSSWNCSQTLRAVLGAISNGEFNNTMAASQLTPSLQGRTYLDVRGLKCSTDHDNLPIISSSPNPTVSNVSSISVTFGVIDGVFQSFDKSITVNVPKGSTFLEVMEEAQRLNPQYFSFTSEITSWGPYLVSVNGLTANTNDKTYWQLLSGSRPLQTAANGDPRVTQLLIEMLQSFSPTDTANPSILLALRLASDHNLPIEHAMIESLKKDAVNRVQNNQDFSSGTVALYVMALRASCENPCKVSALNSTVDLVQLLKYKYQQELNSIELHGRPLTNYFQIGLDIMALCLQNHRVNVKEVLKVICPRQPDGPVADHSVDTASVLALGLTCANRIDGSRPVTNAVRCLVQRILNGKQADGVIGNIYSTGLAMQALIAAKNYYMPSRWNCAQTLSAALDAISKGQFNNPMAASQLTPSLQGRTYLDAGSLRCSADQDNLPIPTPSPPTTAPVLSDITVSYRVVDGVSHSFDYSITVNVPGGSTYLTVMQEAQTLNPLHFSFTTQSSSWGPYLVSINDLAASTNDKTYWQLLSGSTPLIQGIADYKPSAGENLVSNFTTY